MIKEGNEDQIGEGSEKICFKEAPAWKNFFDIIDEVVHNFYAKGIADVKQNRQFIKIKKIIELLVFNLVHE